MPVSCLLPDFFPSSSSPAHYALANSFLYCSPDMPAWSFMLAVPSAWMTLPQIISPLVQFSSSLISCLFDSLALSDGSIKSQLPSPLLCFICPHLSLLYYLFSNLVYSIKVLYLSFLSPPLLYM